MARIFSFVGLFSKLLEFASDLREISIINHKETLANDVEEIKKNDGSHDKFNRLEKVNEGWTRNEKNLQNQSKKSMPETKFIPQ